MAEGFDQFSAAYDCVPAGAPARFYCIASTERCGSHYLGDLLRRTGAFGDPLEYFHRRNFAEWRRLAGTDEPAKAIDYIRGRRTSANGVFGFKAHYAHFVRLIDLVDFDRTFPDCRFVVLERRDLLGQAISCVKASQTGVWISKQNPTGEPRYDGAEIERALVRLARDRMAWRLLLARWGRPFLLVEHEDLSAAPAPWLAKIAEHVGVDFEFSLVGEPRTSRQADSSNDEWRERYVAEARTLHGAVPVAPLTVAELLSGRELAAHAGRRLWQRIRGRDRSVVTR